MLNNVKYCRGHNLIEVMIALLVLSIGLLGLAGLQATSLQYGHDANVRSLATIAAYDIIERIHTNRDNAGFYTSVQTCSDPATCCDSAGASIENDLVCWDKSIKTSLPDGDGAVTGPDADGYYTVTINWMDRESGIKISQAWVFTP
ncbi:MAG: type IV pilus modification protein PilV [Gammaproteobacteria bacterium]|nr:type IV pilus modification protein PilV [Gammaproteobacteria bacterium]